MILQSYCPIQVYEECHLKPLFMLELILVTGKEYNRYLYENIFEMHFSNNDYGKYLIYSLKFSYRSVCERRKFISDEGCPHKSSTDSASDDGRYSIQFAGNTIWCNIG